MSEQTPPSSSLSIRVILALLIPIAGATVFSLLTSGTVTLAPDNQRGHALLFAGIGLASWFVGWRWYGLKGLGLRGGRPLTAGIGFATLVWLAFLLVRFVTVEVESYG